VLPLWSAASDRPRHDQVRGHRSDHHRADRGAHRDAAAAIASAGSAIRDALAQLRDLDRETVRQERWEKFLAIGRTTG
jgi:hypothetical protein